jgi:hypothetical protein
MTGLGPPRPGASGGDVIGAPSPSDGSGASPRSLPALVGAGARTGSGGGAAGGALRGS